MCKIQQQLTADGRKDREFLFKKMSLKDIDFAIVGPSLVKEISFKLYCCNLFFSFYVLNDLQSDNDSNTVYVLA